MTEDRTPAVSDNPEGLAAEEEDQPIKGRKNGLYGEVSDELAASMQSGWADTELRGLEPIAQAPYAAGRRAKLSAAFPGERLVVPAGRLRVRANDTDYPFRAASEYVHLTGDQTEDAVLVGEPTEGGHDFVLYLLPRSNRENGEFWLDGQGELWVGRRHSLEEAQALLGLPARDVRKAAEELAAVEGVPTRIVRGYDAALEEALAGVLDEERDDELKVFLSGLRLVKDEWEVGELRAACDATVKGFTDVVRELGQAVATSERWIEGTFWRRARVEGNDVGYGSICAAGPHATTLHWVRNDGEVRPGELLLLDAGVETGTLYTADVTRTLPINGRFNELQRKIYDAVYDAQEAGIASVKPGGRFRDFHDAAQRVLAERLLAWGLLDPSVYDVEKVLELGLQRRWTLHGTGHMLGLDVHDCAHARREEYVDAELVPGMVLTVEPGLYFQLDDLTVPEEYRGIGVRIEDDILVTADGNENLSAGLPRTADEVESWMAGLAR
ncbi:aminopeptidase P family protein [Kitasatospora sp. DSM 101779]|uniref:aminopeptidase P family protein n=1 Tax=Kitasatospora sp. DSM 101779 TaxID=2853165 RepID=UPI0021D8E6E5|nr:aminopeptidase P family protein [Kitasatospora sp. DSM 101779]MCU7823843.1 aminopeptidase P family protein [Kitasatospora sp. DSM 101779]